MGLLAWARRHAHLLGLALLVALIPLAVITVRGARLIAQLEPGAEVGSAVLYDAHGDVLTTLGQGHGRYVHYSDLPRHLVDAVIAIEDSRFWRHQGVDVIGIARALLANLRAGARVQGASTITQQVARNLFLSREKTYLRKIQEAIYALLLEIRFSKREILELYLNRSYFGEGAYGVEAAAVTYFGKSTEELSLAESALLAGILQAPSSLSPYNNLDAARARRDVVLTRMHALHMIDDQDLAEAKAAAVALADREAGAAPYFVDYVRAWLTEYFGAERVYRGDLRVWTTLVPETQRAAQEALGEHQGAIVALDPASGAVTAMVGGRSYRESQFNRATHAVRQPGSAFKPFVYAAALERGWQLNDLVDDIPRGFGTYNPRNFRDEYWGTVTMKHALVESLNNAAVWLLEKIGPAAAYEMAERLGISTLTPDDRNLALALGGLTRGTTPLEMAAAYVPFANGGVYYRPHGVAEVRDASGRLLYRHRDPGRRVLSPEVAYFVTDMLEDAVRRGTGSAADIGRPQAGKTGTTNDQVSAWFVGYTPTLVAAVYLGEDDGRPLRGGGGTLAAPVWGRFAARALMDVPAVAFEPPPHVIDGISVDIFTGLLADEGCRYREVSSFVRGREPVEPAPCALGVAQRPVPQVWTPGDDLPFPVPEGPFAGEPGAPVPAPGGAPSVPFQARANGAGEDGTVPRDASPDAAPRLESAFGRDDARASADLPVDDAAHAGRILEPADTPVDPSADTPVEPRTESPTGRLDVDPADSPVNESGDGAAGERVDGGVTEDTGASDMVPLPFSFPGPYIPY